jgi:hypothetical protein
MVVVVEGKHKGSRHQSGRDEISNIKSRVRLRVCVNIYMRYFKQKSELSRIILSAFNNER